MARIRSIHPGILTDEAYMNLTVDCPLAIVLLMGLWMDADDQGVFEWKPLTLKARILPAPSIDINDILSALQRLNFIQKYDVDGRSLGAIRNFCKFQRPKLPRYVYIITDEMRNYVSSTRPPTPEKPLEPAPLPRKAEEPPLMKEEGVGGVNEVGKEEAVAASSRSLFFDGENESSLNGTEALLADNFVLPNEWGLSMEKLGWSRVNILREKEKFRQYWLRKSTPATITKWHKRYTNWMTNAETDYGLRQRA